MDFKKKNQLCAKNDLWEERACYQNHVTKCKSLEKKIVCCSQKPCFLVVSFFHLTKKTMGAAYHVKIFIGSLGKNGPKSPYFEVKFFETNSGFIITILKTFTKNWIF